MLSLKVSQCDSRLNFSPCKPWPPALPAVAWKSWLISGFERADGPAIDVATQAMGFEAAFTSCHPQLTLPELARFFAVARNSGLMIDWEHLFQHYGLRWNENLQELVERLPTTPGDFQAWASEKALGPKDLAILRSFTDTNALAPVMGRIAQLKASKSIGAQILEWSGELILMGKEPLARESTTAEEHWEFIHGLRFPKTEDSDEAKRKRFMALPWPSLSQIKWVRKGDESGLEIRFLVTSPEDLKKKLKGFEHVQQIMDHQADGSWKN